MQINVYEMIEDDKFFMVVILTIFQKVGGLLLRSLFILVMKKLKMSIWINTILTDSLS